MSISPNCVYYFCDDYRWVGKSFEEIWEDAKLPFEERKYDDALVCRHPEKPKELNLPPYIPNGMDKPIGGRLSNLQPCLKCEYRNSHEGKAVILRGYETPIILPQEEATAERIIELSRNSR